MRWTTMKTVIEAKRWHAIFRSDDTLFRHYWRENHPVHSLPFCFTGFSLANALFPRMIFAACHFVFIRDRDTSMNYSPRNERIVSIDFFLLLSLSFFLSTTWYRSIVDERERGNGSKFWGCSFITRVTFDNTTLSNRPNGTRLYRNYAV